MNCKLWLAGGLSIAGATLSSCTNPLIFGTTSTIGVTVSGTSSTPDKLAFAYDRAEFAVVPPLMKVDPTSSGNTSSGNTTPNKISSGKTQPLFGGMDFDYGGLGLSNMTVVTRFYLKQQFATGIPAEIAAANNTTLKKGKFGVGDPEEGANQSHPVLFATGTTFGLKIDTGADSASMPVFILGYRRAEVVVVPIEDNTKLVNSVYANITIASAIDGMSSTNGNLSGNLTGNLMSGTFDGNETIPGNQTPTLLPKTQLNGTLTGTFNGAFTDITVSNGTLRTDGSLLANITGNFNGSFNGTINNTTVTNATLTGNLDGSYGGTFKGEFSGIPQPVPASDRSRFNDGIRIKQSFATGLAAIEAVTPDILPGNTTPKGNPPPPAKPPGTYGILENPPSPPSPAPPTPPENSGNGTPAQPGTVIPNPIRQSLRSAAGFQ